MLRFDDIIRKHNEAAKKNESHSKAIYRVPDALIIICANATVGYTTENGVKIIPIGCLRD